MIASCLVEDYNVVIEKPMITRAIKTGQMFFLSCVWSFNKNYSKKDEKKQEDIDYD
jgi:hypothetical protein